MKLQRTFKREYVNELKYLLEKTGDIIPYYSRPEFPVNMDEVLSLPGIEQPEGLLDKMIPTTAGDFQSAIALYEAYPKLTPVQAADDCFWVYLAHVDLFSYVQKRFPKVMEEDFYGDKYIRDHWFSRQNIEGNILKRHWWSVHLSIDENLEDKYRYSRLIFSDYAARTYHFTSSTIARHKEAVIGILKFFYDNEDVYSKCFRGRLLFVTKYFNKMGGAKCLVALNRNFFYNELVRLKDKILAIKSEEDAR